jgi:hypothetical protein
MRIDMLGALAFYPTVPTPRSASRPTRDAFIRYEGYPCMEQDLPLGVRVAADHITNGNSHRSLLMTRHAMPQPRLTRMPNTPKQHPVIPRSR